MVFHVKFTAVAIEVGDPLLHHFYVGTVVFVEQDNISDDY